MFDSTFILETGYKDFWFKLNMPYWLFICAIMLYFGLLSGDGSNFLDSSNPCVFFSFPSLFPFRIQPDV